MRLHPCLWEEFECVLVGGKSVEDEEQKIYQFLMGMNDTYVQTKSNMIMMKPLPSIDNVYGILLSDEK